MRNASVRFAWVSVYAIAMALLEAVVVVYLRALLQVSGDRVALGPYVSMEIWREAATLAMLVAVGWLAGRRWGDRLAYALFAFGLWDIWNYHKQAKSPLCAHGEIVTLREVHKAREKAKRASRGGVLALLV